MACVSPQKSYSCMFISCVSTATGEWSSRACGLEGRRAGVALVCVYCEGIAAYSQLKGCSTHVKWSQVHVLTDWAELGMHAPSYIDRSAETLLERPYILGLPTCIYLHVHVHVSTNNYCTLNVYDFFRSHCDKSNSEKLGYIIPCTLVTA